MRKKYEVVDRLKHLSGFTWDDDKGMNITEETPQETRLVWANLVSVRMRSCLVCR
jgi:hypothetical protein